MPKLGSTLVLAVEFPTRVVALRVGFDDLALTLRHDILRVRLIDLGDKPVGARLIAAVR